MKKLEVRLVRQPGQERVVGQLAEAGPRPASRQVYFEYDPAFLSDPLWLSPFKLPPQPGLIEAIFDEVASAVARWRDHARSAGVRARTATRIGKAIRECLAR